MKGRKKAYVQTVKRKGWTDERREREKERRRMEGERRRQSLRESERETRRVMVETIGRIKGKDKVVVGPDDNIKDMT